MKCFIKVASENQSWIDCEKEIEIIVTMILKILYDRNVFTNYNGYIDKDISSLYSYEYERLKLMYKFCKEESGWSEIILHDKYIKTYEGIDKNMILETLKCDLNDLNKSIRYKIIQSS